MNPSHPSTILRLGRIKDALAREQMTAAQLAAAVFISKRWVHPYIAHLHLGLKVIHIAAWEVHVGGGEHAPVYAGGPGKDAARPRAQTALMRARKARKRINADPVRQAVYLAKKRARRRGGAVVDPLTAWIPAR